MSVFVRIGTIIIFEKSLVWRHKGSLECSTMHFKITKIKIQFFYF